MGRINGCEWGSLDNIWKRGDGKMPPLYEGGGIK